MGVDQFSVLDGIVLAILVVMMARGLAIGVIRETFSLAALAAACVAVSYGRTPVAQWLESITGQSIPPAVLPWVSGALLAVLTIVLVGLVGRWLRRGARAVGLGWADRIAGGALGLAEGALLGLVVIVAAVWLLGADSPLVANSYSLRAYDTVREIVSREDVGLPERLRPAA